MQQTCSTQFGGDCCHTHMHNVHTASSLGADAEAGRTVQTWQERTFSHACSILDLIFTER